MQYDRGVRSLGEPYIDADEFHVRSYVDVKIENLPTQKALIDGGSEICCIRSELIGDMNLPVCKQVNLSGLRGKSDMVNVVRLHVKPVSNECDSVVNIAPSIRVWFAVVPGLNEAVILTPTVVSLLQEVVRYNVLSANVVVSDDRDVNCSERTDGQSNVSQTAAVNYSYSDQSVLVCSNEIDDNGKDQLSELSPDFLDVEQISKTHNNERVADTETLAAEQKSCPSLQSYWEMAEQNKGNFFVDSGLLYHRETIMGHKVNQLCLPECRIPIVLKMGNDAPFAGHMGVKSTRYRVRLQFWFPKMDDRIKLYCSTCKVCQLRAPVKVSDRVPITPIPRDDELPFTHLVMDCIGPILRDSDSTVKKQNTIMRLLLRTRFQSGLWPIRCDL